MVFGITPIRCVLNTFYLVFMMGTTLIGAGLLLMDDTTCARMKIIHSYTLLHASLLLLYGTNSCMWHVLRRRINVLIMLVYLGMGLFILVTPVDCRSSSWYSFVTWTWSVHLGLCFLFCLNLILAKFYVRV